MPQTAAGPLTTAQLHDWYAVPDGRADWVRANFITSLDGRATGPAGVSGDLNAGSAGDHAAFSAMRDLADVVIVGAGTARAEGYRPLPRVPLLVLTATGDIPDGLRHPGVDEAEVVVLGGEGTEVTPEQVLSACHTRGWRRLLIEGGPQLFAPWVQAGLVDELCVTVRPMLIGGDGPLLLPPDSALPAPSGRATHLLTWGGDVLLRTALR